MYIILNHQDIQVFLRVFVLLIHKKNYSVYYNKQKIIIINKGLKYQFNNISLG